MVVIDDAMLEAATPLILAIIGLIIQYIISKDTNKHGDAFISMLKSDAAAFNRIAEVLPSLAPYAEDFADLVNEADSIWNSGGLTAQDVQALRNRAQIIMSQYNDALAKYRALKEAVKTPIA